MVVRYEFSIDYSRFDSRKQETFGKKREDNHPFAFVEKLVFSRAIFLSGQDLLLLGSIANWKLFDGKYDYYGR